MHRSTGSLHSNHGRFIVMTTNVLLFLLLAVHSAMAQPDILQIDGDPLDIYCYETGQMALWFQGVYQYYNEDSWGSVLMLDDGETTQKYGDQYHQEWNGNAAGLILFTGVSNTKTNDWRVDTVMDAGDSGVRITRTVQYTNGQSYYKMTFSIRNQGDTTYTNCKFIHGGDAYFAGDDAAQSYWDSNLGMVFLRNPGLSGLMGFYGGLDSAADQYFGGEYDLGVDQAVAGELDNTVDSDFVDAGYHLQWNRASLAPGQTWVITAYEKWTEAGDVQVLAPAEQTGVAGSTLDLYFLVQNFQPDSDTFDLSAVSAQGWTTSLPDGDSVTLDSGESAYITVRVVLPEGADDDTITLTVNSQSDDEVTNSDSVTITLTGETPTANQTFESEEGGPCFISTVQTSSHGTGIVVALFCLCFSLAWFPRRMYRRIGGILALLAFFGLASAPAVSAADVPKLQFGLTLGFTDFSGTQVATYAGQDFDLKVKHSLSPGYRLLYNHNDWLGIELGANLEWYRWDLNPAIQASSDASLLGYSTSLGPVFSLPWRNDIRLSLEPAVMWRKLDYDLSYPILDYKSALGYRVAAALSKGNWKAEAGWTQSHHDAKDALEGASGATHLDLNGYFVNLVYYFTLR